jgi:hypothetical protein
MRTEDKTLLCKCICLGIVCNTSILLVQNKCSLSNFYWWFFVFSGSFALARKDVQPEENNDIERTTVIVKEEEEEENDVREQMDANPSSHILMFHPWNTKSHRIQQNALLSGFLARGHRVTGVFPQESDIRSERYSEIVVEDR